MFGIPDQLLITLAGNIVSGLIMLGGGLFVLTQDWRGKLNRLFFFLTMATLVYTVLFVIAAAQTEHFAAYFWWFLNIFDVFITISVVHFIFAVIKKDWSWRWFIILTYVVGLGIFAAAWFMQFLFLPDVTPKLYFLYYLNAGPLYSVMLAYFLFMPLVAFLNLLVSYWYSSGIERKRLEYFILMLVVGYTIGCLNFLLVYNVPVDPLFGMFLGFYFIPVAYGIFATNLMDIRLVVRRAFIYGLSIGAVAAFLAALILLNAYLVHAVPWLQFWTVPLVVSVVAVIIARVVWSQTKDTDRLKYEFITIAAHKLRTPLTRIRWEIPDLIQRATDPTLKEGLVRIDVANNRLIELTNILLEAAHTEDTQYSYKRERVDLAIAVKNAVGRFETQTKEKNLNLVVEIQPDSGKPMGDQGRLASVIDILVENAVIYTPQGGSIRVALNNEHGRVHCSVSDTGIGVKPEDQDKIFSSFFRTDAAKTSDTEGVGIGLAVAKSIIEKHNGKIGVTSGGEGKGSTFWFTLPV